MEKNSGRALKYLPRIMEKSYESKNLLTCKKNLLIAKKLKRDKNFKTFMVPEKVSSIFSAVHTVRCRLKLC